jgi:ABC-type tungstate transport system permease subunit
MPNRNFTSKSLRLPAWSVTTSTQDSRLFGHILPLFKGKTGIDVKVVAQGESRQLN